MRWRGLELDEAKLRTNIKVKLTKRLLDLERKVLQDLMANQCDKCQQLVIFLMKEFRGYLTEVSLGCIQLTLFFSNIEDLQRGRSPDSVSKIQKFLDKLLLTKTIRPISGSVRFSLTLPEQEGFTNKNDTIVYNRLLYALYSGLVHSHKKNLFTFYSIALVFFYRGIENTSAGIL